MSENTFEIFEVKFQSESQKERNKGEYEGRSILVQEKKNAISDLFFVFRLCVISSRMWEQCFTVEKTAQPLHTSRMASTQ